MAVARIRAGLNRLRDEWASARYLGDDFHFARLAREYHLAGNFRRIYHFHIRKTGGTSLNHMFLSLSGHPGAEVYAQACLEPYRPVTGNGKIFVGWNQKLIERGHYFYAFSHMPSHRLRLPPHTFTVTCLRDPAARVISLYTMIMGYRDEPAPDRRKRRQLQWLGNSFGDFLANLPPEELLNQIYMFSPALDRNEAFDKIVGCSQYLLTEEFSRGVQTLASQLQLPLKAIHVRQSPVRPELTRLEMEQLRDRLEPEYLLYEKLREHQSSVEDHQRPND